jgi:hypothetical protein
MKHRCPSAEFYGIAVLLDHQLAFTRYSKGRDCGVADAIPQKGSCVWGVVYEISDQEISPLDKSEGFRSGRAENAYVRQTVRVLMNGSYDLFEDGLELTPCMKKGGQVPFWRLSANNPKGGHHYDHPGKTRKT